LTGVSGGLISDGSWKSERLKNKCGVGGQEDDFMTFQSTCASCSTSGTAPK